MSDRFATLQARAALSGYALHADPNGGFYATRWGQLRMFDALDECEAWVDRVSGVRRFGAYEAGKSAFLSTHPHASADEIEEHAKRLARQEGL